MLLIYIWPCHRESLCISDDSHHLPRDKGIVSLCPRNEYLTLAHTHYSCTQSVLQMTASYALCLVPSGLRKRATFEEAHLSFFPTGFEILCTGTTIQSQGLWILWPVSSPVNDVLASTMYINVPGIVEQQTAPNQMQHMWVLVSIPVYFCCKIFIIFIHPMTS